ncbi:MAG: metal-sensitive transcriptional regulator [Anaerolineales bacterium]|nr:metal-sensitive transcriptional regulator [Anaerolineales bacterium]
MDEKQKAETLRRLRSIKGHVSGIERMLEDDAYCIDVIKQIQAVQAALNKVSVRLLDNHLRSCVVTAVNSRSAKERERVLAEIADVFETATRV